MFLRRLILALAGALLLGLTVAAATDFDQAVLTRLSREQILAYQRSVDAQLTDSQRGAKYRWGAVPVDREPPYELGLWWTRLTPAERDEQMVAWFRSHIRAISLDDVRSRIAIGPLIEEVRAQHGPDPVRETVPWWMRRDRADSPTTPIRRVVAPVTATEPPARGMVEVVPPAPAPRSTPAAAAPAPVASRVPAATRRPPAAVRPPAAPPRPPAGAANRPAAPPLRPVPGQPAPDASIANREAPAATVASPPVAGGDAPTIIHRDALPVTLRNSE